MITYQLSALSAVLFETGTTTNYEHRWDCLQSSKGGKRMRGDKSAVSVNPCFANRTSYLNYQEKYIDDTRDCSSFRGSLCTLESPCVPCELDKAIEFGDVWKRCNSCNGTNHNCDFVEGVGPYCYVSVKDLSRIEPCSTCCTRPNPLIFENNNMRVCI